MRKLDSFLAVFKLAFLMHGGGGIAHTFDLPTANLDLQEFSLGCYIIVIAYKPHFEVHMIRKFRIYNWKKS